MKKAPDRELGTGKRKAIVPYSHLAFPLFDFRLRDTTAPLYRSR